MSAFKLQNINTVNFTGTGTGVSMTHTAGGVSVDGVIVATTGVSAGTLRLASGSITDTGGSINFVNENLVTTGTLGCGVLTATSGSTIGNLTLADGSITDSSSAISFANDNLSTTGGISAGAGNVGWKFISIGIGTSLNEITTKSGFLNFVYIIPQSVSV